MLSSTLKKWQDASLKIRDNGIFQGIVISIILLSSLTIGARTYNINSYIDVALHWVDNAITLFFLFELIIRITAEKRWYHFFSYKNGWNWFDTLIVIVHLFPLIVATMCYSEDCSDCFVSCVLSPLCHNCACSPQPYLLPYQEWVMWH